MPRLLTLVLTMGMLFGGAQTGSAATPPSPATAQNGGALMSDAQLRQQIRIMKKDLRPDTTLLWRPVITANGSTAALEYWHRPRPPAVHVAEAEYVIVMEGSGSLVSGGSLVNPRKTYPGLLEGDEIQGGASRELKRGDVFLIPAGMPHWFGIHGEGLVMLGIKLAPAP